MGDIDLSVIRFDEYIKNVQSVIDRFGSGKRENIAIIGESFAGKTTLIEEICRLNQNRVETRSFSSFVKDEKELQPLEKHKKIKVLDNCQYLYMRKIGGFDIIDHFLKRIAYSEDELYISTWNVHAWNFLENLMRISSYFPVQIKIEGFTKKLTREYLLSDYRDGEIQFIEDTKVRADRIIEIDIEKMTVPGREIGIPHIKIDRRQIKDKIFKNSIKLTPEEKVFENIYSISKGNPGVSKAIWDMYLVYPKIKADDIEDHIQDIGLDNETCFILSLLISTGNIRESDLFEIAGDDIDIEKTLYFLLGQNLIDFHEGYYSIRSEKLKRITEYLRRSRLV